MMGIDGIDKLKPAGFTTIRALPTGDRRMHQLDLMIEELEKDPSMAYTITQDGKPIAVLLSPGLYDRMEERLKELGGTSDA